MKRLALLLMLLPTVAWGGVTWTLTEYRTRTGEIGTLYRAAIVSDGSGNASSELAMNGVLMRMETDPGATAPTAAYDCVLNGPSGGDILGGGLGDLSATASAGNLYAQDADGTTVFPMLMGPVTLSCSAMGDSKVTTLWFLVLEE